MSMKSKTCKQCGEQKELAEYYRRRATVDGYFGKCKVCVSLDAKARRQDPRRRDKLLAKEREIHSRYRKAHPIRLAERKR